MASYKSLRPLVKSCAGWPPSAASRWFSNSVDPMVAPASFARNEEIFGEGEPVKYIFKIESGCVRTCTTLNDGRRQIGAFYVAGDYFGLEAVNIHNSTAEAVTPSKIRALNRSTRMSGSADDIVTIKHLLNLTGMELERTQRHNLIFLKSARERVVSFLIEMTERLHEKNDFNLPMGRQDIADYLGLTIETVSRMLKQLECGAMISVPTNRRIVLNNLPALNHMIA